MNYWRKQLILDDINTIRLLSNRMENFMFIIFRQSSNLKVQLSVLDVLRKLVNKKYDLSESLFQIIECCLYDREKSIATKSITILKPYSKRNPLPITTIVCLEELLTTETPIRSDVISISKICVGTGHVISKRHRCPWLFII